MVKTVNLHREEREMSQPFEFLPIHEYPKRIRVIYAYLEQTRNLARAKQLADEAEDTDDAFLKISDLIHTEAQGLKVGNHFAGPTAEDERAMEELQDYSEDDCSTLVTLVMDHEAIRRQETARALIRSDDPTKYSRWPYMSR